jgi:uncharacterized protein YkwD
MFWRSQVSWSYGAPGHYVDEPDISRRRHWAARLAMLAALLLAGGLIGTAAAVGSGGPPARSTDAAAAFPSVEPPLPPTSGSPDTGQPAAAVDTTPTPTPARTTPAAKPPPEPTGLTPAEAEVFMLVNAERAKVGCAPLTVDSRLVTAARRHSADMAARDYFDHTTPDGVNFATRITEAGYRWSMAGENIAKGQQTPASVMRAWMNSPGHRANILNCKYRNIGVGLAYSPRHDPVWTQDFATPLR